jgi:hypothetical protein
VLSKEQRDALTTLLSELTPGHVSTLIASLNEADSQIGTSTDSKHYAFLNQLCALGLSKEVGLDVDLPADLMEGLTSFTINEDAKAEIAELIQSADLDMG